MTSLSVDKFLGIVTEANCSLASHASNLPFFPPIKNLLGLSLITKLSLIKWGFVTTSLSVDKFLGIITEAECSLASHA